MNPDLQKQLAELLAKLMDVAGDAAKWTAQQVPPLVQEKIVFGRVYETAFFLALLAVIAVAVRCVPRFARTAQQAENVSGEELANTAAAVIFSIGGVVSGIVAIVQLETLVMVWFAPRLYIVEWLRSMVTK